MRITKKKKIKILLVEQNITEQRRREQRAYRRVDADKYSVHGPEHFHPKHLHALGTCISFRKMCRYCMINICTILILLLKLILTVILILKLILILLLNTNTNAI